MADAKTAYSWALIDRVANTAVTFAGNIVLARLLTPFDFGLLAMVGIFSAIAYNISSCGLSDGLIKKLSPTREDYSTVFVFNGACGLFFGLLAIACAHPIANYFGHSQLVGIMYAIGVCFFFQTLSFVQETRMRKALSMYKMCMVRLSATVTAVGLGIVLALNGYGYWGLVSSQVFLSFFTFIYYVIASRWIPRIAFYRESFREMFGFGFNLMLAYVFNMIGKNVNTFVLGKQSPVASGVFYQAQKMEETPFSLTESISWTFYAVLSNESDRGKRALLSENMFRTQCMISALLATLLMLLSSPGVNFVFGAKWVAAIPVFRILLFYGMCFPLKVFFQTVLKAHGRASLIRNLTILEVSLQIALLFVVYRYGILAIAWSQVAVVAVVLGCYVLFYSRMECTTVFRLFKIAVSPLAAPLAASAVTAAGYMLWNGHIPDFVSCLLIVAVYGIVAVAVWEFFPQPFYIKCRDEVAAWFRRLKHGKGN